MFKRLKTLKQNNLHPTTAKKNNQTKTPQQQNQETHTQERKTETQASNILQIPTL